MTTQQILNLNTIRNPEANEIIQKVLRKIKPLSKYEDMEEDIPLELVERVIHTIVSKYHVGVQWISHESRLSIPEVYWSISIKTTDTHKWLVSIQAATMYELLAKTAIKLYSLAKSDELTIRDIDEGKRKKENLSKELEEDE